MSIGNGYGTVHDSIIFKKKILYTKKNESDKEFDKLVLSYTKAGLFEHIVDPSKKIQDVRLDSCEKLGNKINSAHRALSFEDNSYNNMCWDIINACGGIERMEEMGLNTSNELNNEALKFKP